MKIYVKNMVCERCNMAVSSIFQRLGYVPRSIKLGEVDLAEQVLTAEKLSQLAEMLSDYGFELIEDRRSRLIEQIKTSVINFINNEQALMTMNLSEIIGRSIPHDYGYLSSLFSSVEGITIEQYFILQKIERVKELLIYDELTLTHIADRLAYSSAAHLSSQFKKVTGMTPSHFKALRDAGQRKPLDKLS